MRTTVGGLLAATIALAMAYPAKALVSFGEPVPVERLVQNCGAYLERYPEDPQAHFVLARVHSMAYQIKTGVLVGYERRDGALPWVSPPERQDWFWPHDIDPRAEEALPSEEQLREHARLAIVHYNRAIRLDGDNALYKLALAWHAEETRHLAAALDVAPLVWEELPEHAKGARNLSPTGLVQSWEKSGDRWLRDYGSVREESPRLRERWMSVVWKHTDDVPPEVRERVVNLRRAYWEIVTADLYFAAFCDALAQESALTERPLGMIVAREAGEQYLRYADTIGEDLPIRRRVVRQAVREFKNLPRSRAIDPLVVVWDSALDPADAIDREARVSFDLDGFGTGGRWDWFAPGAALLVWDPEGKGNIASGRQLFGNATWWLFFADGFSALAALDDDGDGRVAGAELHGLALWFDRNGDGVSDEGEVTPVTNLGVVSIATTAQDEVGDEPAALEGVVLENGETRTVFDWMARRTPEESAAD